MLLTVKLATTSPPVPVGPVNCTDALTALRGTARPIVGGFGTKLVLIVTAPVDHGLFVPSIHSV